MPRVAVREICHEASEVLDPRVVIVTVDEINHFLVRLLRHIQCMSPLALIVQEGEDIDGDSQLILDCWDIFYGHWVGISSSPY